MNKSSSSTVETAEDKQVLEDAQRTAQLLVEARSTGNSCRRLSLLKAMNDLVFHQPHTPALLAPFFAPTLDLHVDTTLPVRLILCEWITRALRIEPARHSVPALNALLTFLDVRAEPRIQKMAILVVCNTYAHVLASLLVKPHQWSDTHETTWSLLYRVKLAVVELWDSPNEAVRTATVRALEIIFLVNTSTRNNNTYSKNNNSSSSSSSSSSSGNDMKERKNEGFVCGGGGGHDRVFSLDAIPNNHPRLQPTELWTEANLLLTQLTTRIENGKMSPTVLSVAVATLASVVRTRPLVADPIVSTLRRLWETTTIDKTLDNTSQRMRYRTNLQIVLSRLPVFAVSSPSSYSSSSSSSLTSPLPPPLSSQLFYKKKRILEPLQHPDSSFKRVQTIATTIPFDSGIQPITTAIIGSELSHLEVVELVLQGMRHFTLPHASDPTTSTILSRMLSSPAFLSDIS